jgi:hypothetical protein
MLSAETSAAEYRPYLLQGKPVQVETQVTVNFTLLP